MTEPSAKVAAFFDFDRTIVDTDGGVLFAQEFIRYYRRKLKSENPGTLGTAWRVFRYNLHIAGVLTRAFLARGLYHLRLLKRSKLVAIAYGTTKDVPIDEIRFLARDFADEVLLHRMFPEARALMEAHRKQGHLVIIATTNMRLIVEPLKRHVPIDDVIGIELDVKGGVCTGGFAGPTYGAEKAQAIREYAHRRNISLPRSYAYTDHYSDHFILPLVGNPHVVNPKWRMRRIAAKHRWTVLKFNANRRAEAIR